ncbi:MAG: hypothetical protein ACK4UN_08025 [Limisphaerales bacterium]
MIARCANKVTAAKVRKRVKFRFAVASFGPLWLSSGVEPRMHHKPRQLLNLLQLFAIHACSAFAALVCFSIPWMLAHHLRIYEIARQHLGSTWDLVVPGILAFGVLLASVFIGRVVYARAYSFLRRFTVGE